MTLWKIAEVDPAFIAAFEDAGEPDQAVIDAYLARSRRKVTPQKHDGIKRWYYLRADNHRIRLGTVARPLADFAGKPAKMLVGTSEIIGEFPGNHAFVGQQGLRLTMEPIEWLHGDADKAFATGSEALAEISEQILDLRRAKRVQQEIAEKYQWRKH